MGLDGSSDSSLGGFGATLKRCLLLGVTISPSRFNLAGSIATSYTTGKNQLQP